MDILPLDLRVIGESMAKNLRRLFVRKTEDEARERRIQDEIVVDAYDGYEQAVGWHAYLDSVLQFPFDAVCDAAREISVLRPSDEVTVLGMADAEECGREMFVRIRGEGRHVLAVPLMQLRPDDDVDEATAEAVEDWRYWVTRGYQF